MSTTTAQTRPTASNRRGGRGGGSQSGNRGAAGGGRRRNNANPRPQDPSTTNGSRVHKAGGNLEHQMAAMTLGTVSGAAVGTEAATDHGDEEEADLCLICTEPVKFYSVAECNHRTCHVCAVRLRALYKKTECTFCKVSSSFVLQLNALGPAEEYSSMSMNSTNKTQLSLLLPRIGCLKSTLRI